MPSVESDNSGVDDGSECIRLSMRARTAVGSVSLSRPTAEMLRDGHLHRSSPTSGPRATSGGIGTLTTAAGAFHSAGTAK